MSEEAKRSITGGAVVVKPNTTTDDRRTSTAAPIAKRVIIKSADMRDNMQKEAVDIAISAFEKHGVEKDVAEHIKKEFDRKHGPTWHCIVGRNFDVTKNLNPTLNSSLPFGPVRSLSTAQTEYHEFESKKIEILKQLKKP